MGKKVQLWSAGTLGDKRGEKEGRENKSYQVSFVFVNLELF